MTDDKSKRDFRDRDRINRNEDYEIAYWGKALGVTRQKLLNAIDHAGPMVTDVRRQLAK